MLEVNDKNFEEKVEKTKGVTVVDFWAKWCGPCRMLSPIIEELSSEMKDKATICKCNIDENSEAPAKYGVRSIPTLIVIKDGKLVDTRTGAASKNVIKEWIEKNI